MALREVDELLPAFVPMAPRGRVSAERVDISWGAARFRGGWIRDREETRLEGHIETPLRHRFPLIAFYLVVAILTVIGVKWGIDTRWEGAPKYFLLVPALITFIGMPIVVLALGTGRVASEIELVRIIGQAIGDPQQYAAKWRRWQND